MKPRDVIPSALVMALGLLCWPATLVYANYRRRKLARWAGKRVRGWWA